MTSSPRRRYALRVEELETRNLLTFGLTSVHLTQILQLPPSQVQLPDPTPVVHDLGSVLGANPDLASSLRQMIPGLSSNPGASHTLYLNFGGDYRKEWSRNEFYPYGQPQTFQDIKTVPFKIDGDLTAVTDLERAAITEIWARVAEAYAPFDVNVTTLDPGNLDDGKTLMVNIGQESWYQEDLSTTGISSVGSFKDPNFPNIVFVFTTTDLFGSKLDPDYNAKVANTVVHESGHGFGLFHHQVLNDDGTLQNQYDPGVGNWTPFMGSNANARRHYWGIGMTGEVGTDAAGNPYDNRALQVDTNVLGDALGFRADDFGDDLGSATPVDVSSGTGSVQGIVGVRPFDFFGPENRDVDVFSFDNSYSGTVILQAKVVSLHNASTLNARIELWTDNGLIAAANPYDDQGNAQLAVHVAPGTYYVKVMGVSAFDGGQYTLTVNAPSFTPKVTLESGVSRVGQLINGFAADTNGFSQAELATAGLDTSGSTQGPADPFVDSASNLLVTTDASLDASLAGNLVASADASLFLDLDGAALMAPAWASSSPLATDFGTAF